jgi:general secretion pathway protein G
MKFKNNGFTLLEMLVVLVIIGLLAGLIGPRIWGEADKAKIKTADTQVKMLRGALQTLYLDVGRFPTNQESLSLLWQAPADEHLKPLWRGPYLDEQVPLDPWGNPYQYSLPGSNNQPFALYSLGADGQIGGTGNAADIGYLPPGL